MRLPTARYSFSEVKGKDTGNRLAYIGPALHNERSAPGRGKKKTVGLGQMILCAHFRNTILTGGFEEHFKAAVSFDLKWNDVLATSAAYRREPPMTRSYRRQILTGFLLPSKKVWQQNGGSLAAVAKIVAF